MLQMVQINPTELCNRRCSFCPRSDRKVYPNRNKHITTKTIENLCVGLNELKFNNRVGFVGFGEPLLHKNIFKCIEIVKKNIPTIKYLEVNTNGDKLTKETIKRLYESGCSHLAISMYDRDKSGFFNKLKGDIPINIIYRHHYSKKENYNLSIVNRDELLTGTNKVYSTDSCYIPFYKAMIDWNGDVLLCENDWSRKNIFGNINKKSFSNIWLSEEFIKFRKELLKGRSCSNPCKNCSVNGLTRGSQSVEIFKKNYKLL